MIENIYNPQKLTQELQVAGLPVAGVSSTGRIDYSRELTATERNNAEDVINQHDPSPETKDLRLQTYLDSGITIEQMVLALWDQIIKDDSSAVAVLKEKIEAIDFRIN